MSVVVSDTSPIRAMAHLGLLPLLSEIYGGVVIPQAVFSELLRKGKWFDSVPVAALSKFEVRFPTDEIRITHEFLQLDVGEREAIQLALELNADALLIDEAAGRSVAKQYGLLTTGTLGVLSQAKQRGFVSAVKPLLDRLLRELNFFISPTLRDTVLKDLGECDA